MGIRLSFLAGGRHTGAGEARHPACTLTCAATAGNRLRMARQFLDAVIPYRKDQREVQRMEEGWSRRSDLN